MTRLIWTSTVTTALLAVSFSAFVFGTELTPPSSDTEDLKQMVDNLQKRIKEVSAASAAEATPVAEVAASVADKFSDDQNVTTRAGKLRVGGLMQVWYQHISNDHLGITQPAPGNFLFGNDTNNGNRESNAKLQNDTFRIRRMELRFGMDITEHIFAYIMIDPSRAANGTFTPFPTFPLHNLQINNGLQGSGVASGQKGAVPKTLGRNGNDVPSLLQDAFIDFNNFVPHHDFRVGQFKPPSGEESWRATSDLDFVDRSLVGARNNVRDIGVMMQGGWFLKEKDDVDTGLIQYWLGAFNGTKGTVLTDPELQEGGNRSDDNNRKDIAERFLVRPLWDEDCWPGKLELGYARTDGHRGKDGTPSTFIQDPRNLGTGISIPAIHRNGTNEFKNAISRQSAWLFYQPNGVTKGLWLRGEWGSNHDRLDNTGLLGLGFNSLPNSAIFVQGNPQPISLSGFYLATGYKLGESCFADCLNQSSTGKALKGLEFAFRFESFQNIVTERGSVSNKNDPNNPMFNGPVDKLSNRYSSEIYTLGVNYYIRGQNAKIQANYAFVTNPAEGHLGLRNASNDQFVVNFQFKF